MATDMIAPYQITNFVAGDALPALPTNDTGWVFQSGATVTAEQVAQLATALGVTGEPATARRQRLRVLDRRPQRRHGAVR